MQSLTAEQSDALLDLVEQCHLVHHTFEQAEIAKKKGELLALNRHQKELKTLTDIFVKCDYLGIDQDLLMHILVTNLPEKLSVAITLPGVA